MRLKLGLLALSLSVLCLHPQKSYADTLELTGVGGQSTDGVFVNPYLFTVTGPEGTNTGIDLSCLSFNREVYIGESWTVNPYNVLDIPTNELDGLTEDQFLADALLYNQYAAAVGNATLTSEIQYAIWSIMDPTDINSSSSYANAGAFDSTSQTLAADAIADVAGTPLSVFANDEVFIPVAGTQPQGDDLPQIYMADSVPSAVTPEPAPLLLLGTGMIGLVAVLRRRPLHA